MGQAIVTEICADPAAFAALKCPPRVMGRPDVHIGFAAAYGEAYLPQPRPVAELMRAMTGVHG
jgi:2-oxoisovalerate dehydrogenase E1 component